MLCGWYVEVVFILEELVHMGFVFEDIEEVLTGLCADVVYSVVQKV